ncbi:2-amino-4-hydroxy-6-hydroxymethyldihydropteridine diphosphokinase [Polaromonas sp. JS666]|uniref:2-amino-4-hydroxy-6- hydroxymethyldihydropteridine diphosphokinase n=1 Tax=Polaromonas sp. (strain JS666 / ATCC BAA-500) TaxID=296591 RepID=UPI000883F296|nr:2-amino-4-hydroxy-6-hydroxymethyldihydropteridine diphosphokinase [Polaromonas sp. JS666]SDN31028.1 2-amino-4-hydroxy-6-hydroxymethyldihydropteridinediphosphokinase [Polaromonas sp. JS666]
MATVSAYIALGANLGDAAAALRHAVKAIAQLPQTQLVKASSIYKTAPLVSGGGQAFTTDPAQLGGDYLNAVVKVETGLSAPALLQGLQQIEQAAGRERPYPNAPRTLDLDLLLYGSASIESARLMVPHPRMWERAFVLVPLAEIAPGLVGDLRLQAVRHQAIAVFDVNCRL